MRKRWSRAVGASLTVILGATLAAAVAPGTASADDPPAADGLTQQSAAASCWEIKQNHPEQPSGAYWLQTPALVAPQQFYCDQTYDGGGWVLIGKGREGWQEFYQGQGDPAELAARTTPTPSYFTTVQLPSTTIDGLLDGQDVSALTDGVRVLRSRTSDGSQWQNVQFRYRDRDRWVWTLTGNHPLASYRFDNGQWFSGGVIQNFGRDSAYLRLAQSFSAATGWTTGFGYGSQVAGQNNPTTFLWSASGHTPRPYSEVYLRPQLRSTDLGYEPIPDAGTPESTQRAMVSSYAARGSWGVTGHFNGRRAEGNSEVQSFAEHGDVMFVAGNFEWVQQGADATGDNRVRQPALAAFDRGTGDFIRTFTPTFDNQVKSIAMLPDGYLLAVGDFTRVNGATARGTVLLDPVTGETVSSWDVQLENRISTGVLTVRRVTVSGDWAYLGGAFTHASGGGVTDVYGRHAMRIDWRSGAPDRSWNPEFDGTLMDGDVSEDGSRFYAAGYFNHSQGEPASKAAAVQTEAGAPLATPRWSPVWSVTSPTRPTVGYQQAIGEVGDRVYVGGSEHSLFGFDTTTFERTSGSLTRSGGDFQTITEDRGVVYAGCHCSNWTLQDSYVWANATAWSQLDRIQWIGAWDAATGEYLPEFNPPFFRSNNAGAWASFVDSDGTLWAGGDFTGVRVTATQGQWAGGFVRFPLNDHTAPAAPANLTLDGRTDAEVNLRWDAVSDSGTVVYEVLRDDRVVLTTTQLAVTVPRAGQDRYAVRAVDSSSNRSASTAVVDADAEPEPPVTETVIDSAAQWRYLYQAQAPGAQWSRSTFDDSDWSTGAAPLGWGSARIATELAPGLPVAQRPIVAYFRTGVQIADLSTAHALQISVVADDGAVVYVNGTEVGRQRVDPGSVGHGTYANAAVSTAAAVAGPLVLDVPRTLLVEGENTVAVSTHLNYRSTPNLTFELVATLTSGDALEPEPDPEPEPEPEPIAIAPGSGLRYHYEAHAPAAGWTEPSFDDSGWSAGDAPLGWGSGPIATPLGLELPTAQRPVVAYARAAFEVTDVETLSSFSLSVVADDGAVVYVNGTEVGRARVDPGPVTHTTFANAAISTANATANPLVIEVPTELLAAGENVVAVSTHLNYRSTPNLSLDLSGTVVRD